MTRPSATPAAETPQPITARRAYLNGPLGPIGERLLATPPLSSSLRWPRPSARLTAGGFFFFGFAHGTQGRGEGAARRSDAEESQ